MNIVAGRLRAVVHYDISGSWSEAENLQADQARDMGLIDYGELYRARRMAKLTKSQDSSSSSGEERKTKKKKKKKKMKKPRKRGKKKKKEKEEEEAAK